MLSTLIGGKSIRSPLLPSSGMSLVELCAVKMKRTRLVVGAGLGASRPSVRASAAGTVGNDETVGNEDVCCDDDTGTSIGEADGLSVGSGDGNGVDVGVSVDTGDGNGVGMGPCVGVSGGVGGMGPRVGVSGGIGGMDPRVGVSGVGGMDPRVGVSGGVDVVMEPFAKAKAEEAVIVDGDDNDDDDGNIPPPLVQLPYCSIKSAITGCTVMPNASAFSNTTTRKLAELRASMSTASMNCLTVPRITSTVRMSAAFSSKQEAS